MTEISHTGIPWSWEIMYVSIVPKAGGATFFWMRYRRYIPLSRLNFAFPDEGQMFENIVYNELMYKGYSVNVGSFDTVEKDKNGNSIRKTNEVDFFATKGIKKYYIQVCADISNADTRTREIRPYMLLNDEITKIVVIGKPVKESLDENGFTIIGITDFLLKYI